MPSTPAGRSWPCAPGMDALRRRSRRRRARRRRHDRGHQRAHRAARARTSCTSRTRASRTCRSSGASTRSGCTTCTGRSRRPLVERRDCVGVAGRVDHHGAELEPLDAASLSSAARRARACSRARRASSVAVCLLFSYLRPDHERAVRRRSSRGAARRAISLSHEVSPVWREYERASTTIADAFVKPVDRRRTSTGVGSALSEASSTAAWSLLASNGGHLSARGGRAATRRSCSSRASPAASSARPHFARARRARVGLLARHGRHELRHRRDPRRRSAVRAASSSSPSGCRSPCRASTSARSAPAAARSPASTRAACCTSGPRSAGAEPGPGGLRHGRRASRR